MRALGIEHGSSSRVVYALYHWAISSQQTSCFCLSDHTIFSHFCFTLHCIVFQYRTILGRGGPSGYFFITDECLDNGETGTSVRQWTDTPSASTSWEKGDPWTSVSTTIINKCHNWLMNNDPKTGLILRVIKILHSPVFNVLQGRNRSTIQLSTFHDVAVFNCVPTTC